MKQNPGEAPSIKWSSTMTFDDRRARAECSSWGPQSSSVRRCFASWSSPRTPPAVRGHRRHHRLWAASGVDCFGGNGNGPPGAVLERATAQRAELDPGHDGTIRAPRPMPRRLRRLTTNGTRLQIWDCNATGAQQWIRQPAHDIVFNRRPTSPGTPRPELGRRSTPADLGLAGRARQP